jgi:t-SNARE complex subunit (syntaxin)
MTTGGTASPSEQTRRHRELARLIRQIQTLTVELQNLPQREWQTPEVDAKERTLERLRRQLTAVARPAATDDLLNAA